MFKSSKFNFWATVRDNQHLLFNGVSGALYEFDDEERILTERLLGLNQQPSESRDVSIYNSLLEGGFIIPDSIDEISTLLSLNKIECENHKILDIVISPTYMCNFRCTYCYVDFETDHQVSKMPVQVADRIVSYLNNVIPNYNQLNITWFGGEPLLCLDSVVKISSQIVDIARNHKVSLYMFLTSNGYLLDLATVKKLSSVGIRFYHITIDGPANCHDKLRVQADGQPSYARIMENLIALLEHTTNTYVTLRMNANRSNIDSLCELLDQIPADFHHRIQVNIMPIISSEGSPSVDLYRKINSVIRYALENGYLYYDLLIPVGRRCFCSADKSGNFQIGPDGNVYKCSPSPSKPEVEVGYLNSRGELQLNSKYEIWHHAPLVHKHCLDCPFICFCAGGCRIERLRNNNDVSCRDRYNDIENLIINRYLAILSDTFQITPESIVL